MWEKKKEKEKNREGKMETKILYIRKGNEVEWRGEEWEKKGESRHARYRSNFL